MKAVVKGTGLGRAALPALFAAALALAAAFLAGCAPAEWGTLTGDEETAGKSGGGGSTLAFTWSGAITGMEGEEITPINVSSGASGGTKPYTFSATGLPAGLGISAAGVISGTLETEGSGSAAITVTDSAGAAASGTIAYSITYDGTILIGKHPASKTYRIGVEEVDALTVTASAKNGGDLTYQWYVNTVRSNSGGMPIPDATGEGESSSYTPPVTQFGTRYYYCVVTNPRVPENRHSDTAVVTVETAMIYIEPGRFTMGSPENEESRKSDEARHDVKLTKGFFMGTYEVTQAEWDAVMGVNVRDTPAGEYAGLYGVDPNYPMYFVSWYDAIAYCNKMSLLVGLTPAYSAADVDWEALQYSDIPGHRGGDAAWEVSWNKEADGYRLPTEAEWEYCCRAGTTTVYSYSDEADTAAMNYGYSKNYLCAVGEYEPNLWGLYDMHGNVAEWCWDWYGKYGTQTDPAGPTDGEYRVSRGGGYDGSAADVRSAVRNSFSPGSSNQTTGFRIVRNAQ